MDLHGKTDGKYVWGNAPFRACSTEKARYSKTGVITPGDCSEENTKNSAQTEEMLRKRCGKEENTVREKKILRERHLPKMLEEKETAG